MQQPEPIDLYTKIKWLDDVTKFIMGHIKEELSFLEKALDSEVSLCNDENVQEQLSKVQNTDEKLSILDESGRKTKAYLALKEFISLIVSKEKNLLLRVEYRTCLGFLERLNIDKCIEKRLNCV
jgi:hypothetical protein